MAVDTAPRLPESGVHVLNYYTVLPLVFIMPNTHNTDLKQIYWNRYIQRSNVRSAKLDVCQLSSYIQNVTQK